MKHADKILRILAKQQGISMLGQFRKYPAWKILISTILSARANDKATIPVTKELFKKYKTLKQLANANPNIVKKIIKRTVYYNQKTKYILETAKIILKKYKGKVPEKMEELLTLPGVGYKVAGCVVVYAFNKPDAIPIDTHVAVIANRLGWTKETNPDKIMFDLMKKIPKKHWLMVNELFVVHGQTICIKRKPLCYKCPIVKYCKYKNKNLEA
ncbi:endonuclease III [Candidatus Woesearchaeota archaeon]|nr:endonuclease III [Candidatus Woesearchaeota archaeon]